MKNKKGFTLVELLAIIVILAVIMVIAVPKILDVVNGSKSSAWKDNVGMIKKAIVTNSQLFDPETGVQKYSIGNLCTNPSKLAEIVKLEDTTVSCSNNIFTLTGTGQFVGKSATITCINSKCSINIRKDAVVLAAGLYDSKNSLIASWDSLINDYGLSPDGREYYRTVREKTVDGKLYRYYTQDNIENNSEMAEYGITQAGWYTNLGGPFKGNQVSDPGIENAVVYVYATEKIVSAMGLDDGPGWYYQISKAPIKASGIPEPNIDNLLYGYYVTDKVDFRYVPDPTINSTGWWYYLDANPMYARNDNIPEPVEMHYQKASIVLAGDDLKNGTKLVVPGDLDDFSLKDCTTLKEVVLLNGVTEINYDRQFDGCDNLESLTVPSSVKEIVWYGRDNLKELIIEDTTGWKARGSDPGGALIPSSVLENPTTAAQSISNCNFSKTVDNNGADYCSSGVCRCPKH